MPAAHRGYWQSHSRLSPAFEIFRRLGNDLPDFCQFAVPCVQGVLKVLNHPVITQNTFLLSGRSRTDRFRPVPLPGYWMFSYPAINVRISFANVMITPPASVRNPFARCDGSWDFKDSPICTIPKPSRIIPMARISPKINFGQVIDHGQRIIRCKYSCGPCRHHQHQRRINDHEPLSSAAHGKFPGFLFSHLSVSLSESSSFLLNSSSKSSSDKSS